MEDRTVEQHENKTFRRTWLIMEAAMESLETLKFWRTTWLKDLLNLSDSLNEIRGKNRSFSFCFPFISTVFFFRTPGYRLCILIWKPIIRRMPVRKTRRKLTKSHGARFLWNFQRAGTATVPIRCTRKKVLDYTIFRCSIVRTSCAVTEGRRQGTHSLIGNVIKPASSTRYLRSWTEVRELLAKL